MAVEGDRDNATKGEPHQISNLTCFSGSVLVKNEAPMVDSCGRCRQSAGGVGGRRRRRPSATPAQHGEAWVRSRRLPCAPAAAPHLVLEVLAPHEALHQRGLAAAHVPQQHQLALHELLHQHGHAVRLRLPVLSRDQAFPTLGPCERLWGGWRAGWQSGITDRSPLKVAGLKTGLRKPRLARPPCCADCVVPCFQAIDLLYRSTIPRVRDCVGGAMGAPSSLLHVARALLVLSCSGAALAGSSNAGETMHASRCAPRRPSHCRCRRRRRLPSAAAAAPRSRLCPHHHALPPRAGVGRLCRGTGGAAPGPAGHSAALCAGRAARRRAGVCGRRRRRWRPAPVHARRRAGGAAQHG